MTKNFLGKEVECTTYQDKVDLVVRKATSLHFGLRSLGILRAAAKSPINPYRYFGKSLRRSWSYNYFMRLEAAGLLEMVGCPEGCQGFRWYRTVIKNENCL